jgi:prevent-host-death family protein
VYIRERERIMAKEKVLSFVEARANLSELVDQVSERGQTYIIAKRQKPVAVIVGVEKYKAMSNAGRHLRSRKEKRILKLKGAATAGGDIDRAIGELRKSRIESLLK